MITKEKFYNQIDKCENEDYIIEYIIDTIDNLMSSNNFRLCDEILDIDPTKHKTEVTITLLTITLPAKSELKNRNNLYIKIKEHLLNTVGVTETHELLTGLN